MGIHWEYGCPHCRYLRDRRVFFQQRFLDFNPYLARNSWLLALTGDAWYSLLENG